MESERAFLQEKLDTGIKLFNTNKLDEANEYFKFLEKKEITKKIALFYLGIIQIRKNETNIAKEYFYKILNLDKDH